MEDQQAVAFVLMPFDAELDWIFDDVLAPSLAEVGYRAVRADSVVDQQNILRDIIRGIAQAELILADITGLNANVMYELGLAHRMRKPVVLLTQSIESAPFDLRAYRMTSYSPDFKSVTKLIEVNNPVCMF